MLRPGNVITDGPYSEAREAVAGVLLITSETDAEATKIAAACPFLPRGGSIEIRLVPQLEFEDAAFSVLEAHAQARNSQNGG
ncbi:MAG: hypothetical protein HC806_09760 [Anaerolineae bacterium]|nr:hypothetical protein [Anaerolineae bacterium]